MNVQVTLNLDDDTDHSGSHYYDNALGGGLGNGEAGTFDFVVTLPGDVALGQHYYAIVFSDEHFVLRFEYSGWGKAFFVSGPS